MSDACQRHGGRVLYLSELVQDRVYATNQRRKGLHVLGQSAQGRVGVFRKLVVTVVLVQEVHDYPDGFKRAAQVEELVLFQVCVLQSDARHRFAHVKEVVHGHLLRSLHQATELAYLVQPLVHLFSIVRKGQFVNLFLAQSAQAMLFQQVAYLVKTYLRFVILGVNHATKVV